MNTNKGFTKLIDIHDQSERLHRVMEKYLTQHGIPFRKARFFGDGFIRYSVEPVNLCCAQAVIPALRELASRPFSWTGADD
jgi:hypothetical protein